MPARRPSLLCAALAAIVVAAALPHTARGADNKNGPKTYPISSIFLEGEATPTAKPSPPTPPPDAYAPPVLATRRPDFDLPKPDDDGPTSPSARIALLAAPTATPVPPTPTPSPTPTPTPFRPATEENPLDLNQASIEQLATLPGVSPHRAELIAAHRRAIAGFRHVDQLREVFGVSEELFLKLRPLVHVGDTVRLPEIPTPEPLRFPVRPDIRGALTRPTPPLRPAPKAPAAPQRPVPAVPAPPAKP